MSKIKKPKTELNQLESRTLYKELSSTLFAGWSCEELNKLADTSLNLTFSYSNTIAKKNEPVAWLGILMRGQCLLSNGTERIALTNPGTIIGYQGALQTKTTLFHTFDITAMSEGVLSIFYLEDLLNFPKKLPKIAIKLFEILGKVAAETILNQFFGGVIQQVYVPLYIEYSTRRKQEFIRMHPCFAADKELDRLDIKILATSFRVIHPQDDTLITKCGCVDNSVFFVVEGNTGIFEQKVYEEKVFGVQNFLKPGILWNYSVVGIGYGTVLCMRNSDFSDIVTKHGATAVKFLRLITNEYAKQIFDKKVQGIPVDIRTPQDFVELDTSKLCIEPKLNKITEVSEDEEEIPLIPLYTFPMFEKKIEEIVESKEIKPEIIESLFPKEKLAKQSLEVEAKKKAARMRGVPSPRIKKNSARKPVENDLALNFGEIAKDLKDLEDENFELNKQIMKLEEENDKLMKEINEEDLEVERKDVV